MPRKTSFVRKVPTQAELIGAIVDLWKFADLIGFHGGSVNFGRFHKEMESHYWTHKKRCRIVPRGHLKTTLSILEDLHRIYVNPNVRIFIGTGRKELGQAIMREIQQYLVDPWLQEHVWNSRPHYPGIRLIPTMEKGGMTARSQSRNQLYVMDDDELSYDTETSDRKIIWNQNQVQVLRDIITKDPTVGVGCAGSASTGFHYDVLHFDDIIDFTNYDNEDKKLRIDTWRFDGFAVLDPEYFDEELYERLRDIKPKGKGSGEYLKRAEWLSMIGDEVCVNGTRYFKWDWYGELKLQCGVEDDLKVPCDGVDDIVGWHYYERNVYNNGVDSGQGYLWNEVWEEKTEIRKRKEMSAKHWYRQFLNKVIVDDELILKWENVKFFHPGFIIKEQGTKYWQVRHTSYEKEEPEIIRIFPYIVIDPAAKSNKDSDYTAICVGGIAPDGCLYVFDLKFGRWSAEEWSKMAVDMAEKYQISVIHLESVVFSFTMSVYLRQESQKREGFGKMVTTKEYKPPRDRDKKERIEAGLQPLMDAGMLYLPVSVVENKELKDMFNLFPSDTVHDDPLDVIEMLREIAKPAKKAKDYSRNGHRIPVLGVNEMFGGLY